MADTIFSGAEAHRKLGLSQQEIDVIFVFLGADLCGGLVFAQHGGQLELFEVVLEQYGYDLWVMSTQEGGCSNPLVRQKLQQ